MAGNETAEPMTTASVTFRPRGGVPAAGGRLFAESI